MARPIKETPILFDEVCAIRKPFLLDYKMRCVENAKFGCRFLTVDAYADAVPFYLKNGFMPLNDDDLYDATRLLFFDLVYITDEISR